MKELELKKIWKQEEEIAHIKGWDFSHVDDRAEWAEQDLPWDYDAVVRGYLTDEMKIMDYDTGGGEYLLSLGHPYENTSATEGYPPNVKLCKETLLPLGIDFRECSDPSRLPFEDESFDMAINRHGSFDAKEVFRVLKPGGIFVTQQVGGSNERDLVEKVLPEEVEIDRNQFLEPRKREFEDAGFEIIRAEETFKPIRFFDVGALVWFARVIEWEFKGFSVDRCFDKLLELQKKIEAGEVIEGTAHRFLLVAKK